MFKRTKKGFAIILAVAMLACMIPGTALAANVLDVFSTPTVKDDVVTGLGSVSMELNSNRLQANNEGVFSLPNGFQFVTKVNDGVESDAPYYTETDAQGNIVKKPYYIMKYVWDEVDGTDARAVFVGDKEGNYIEIPKTYDGNENALWHYAKYEQDGSTGLDVERAKAVSPFIINQISKYEVQLKVADDFSGYRLDEDTREPISMSSYFVLHMKEIYVESGFEGNVSLEISENGGGFISTSGKTVAVVKSGAVTTKSTNAPAITEDGLNAYDRDGNRNSNLVEFRITETVEGAIDIKQKSLGYKLPNGLKWQGEGEATIISGEIDGYTSGYPFDTTDLISYSSNMRELYLDFNMFKNKSNSALKIDVSDGIVVDDSSKISVGDITIDVTSKGDTDLSDTSFVGLTYGEYGLNPKVNKTTTIVAGQLDQNLGEFDLDESVANSLNNNRNLSLTLPSGCYWTKVRDNINSRSHYLRVNGFSDSGRTVKYKVETATNDQSKAASFEFKDMQIVASPDFTGDVVVTFGGSEGLTGEITLGTVIAPLSMTVSEAVTVGIGKYAQEIGDVTITENAKEVLADDKDVILHLPDGVSFSSTPTVKVTAGDLDLDDANTKTANNDQDMNIRVDSASAKASTITVSDIYITVNRTVAEGNIKLQVKGYGVLQCNDPEKVYDYANDNDCLPVITPDKTDSYNYTYYCNNGEFKGLKVTNGQIFGSIGTAVEDVIAVCGTPADDSAQKAATLATFTIGSTNYTLNGEDYTMDAAAYISNGRTMLPIRYVAHVLGITEPNIIWDVNLKTVTLSKDGIVVQIAVGSDYMTVNGVKVVIDEDNPGTVAENKDGRVYLPVREICEQYGYSISWDANTQVVTIAQAGADFEALTETATPTEAAPTETAPTETVEATPVQ